ncbi:MAG TPA: SDR family NAD(P)-dependent oxidoreductase, partial [Caulobacter sp.]|nr:SDR family NAD(P)-dependent oxidoreductase [Caulobacter sp.]
MGGAAVITGAARRIGRVLAVQAARSGFDVAVHHRDSPDEAEETAALVRAEGRRACVLAGDLTVADAADLIARAETALGPVTLLVNNASLFLEDRLETFDAGVLDAHMATNVRAPAVLTQAMAARLAGDRTGLVVNILDQRVWRPNPQFFGYSLSKAALW